MKLISIFAIVLLVCLGMAALSVAQPHQGAKELSIAGSFMAIKSEGSRETNTAVNIPVRVGYFVSRNFEVEPELIFSSWEGGDPGYVLSGNLALTFLSAKSNNRFVPYLLAGGGVSNTFPLFQMFTFGKSEVDITYGVLNLGAGVKQFLTSSVALRLEYRYQHFFGGEKTYYYGPGHSFTNNELDVNLHNVFMGASVFLK